MFLDKELDKKRLKEVADKVEEKNKEILKKEEEIGCIVVEYIKQGKSQKETIENLVKVSKITATRLKQIVKEEFFKDKYKLEKIVKFQLIGQTQKYIKEKRLSNIEVIKLLKSNSFEETINSYIEEKNEKAKEVSLKKHVFYTTEDTEILLDTCKVILGKVTGKGENIKNNEVIEAALIGFYTNNQEYLEKEEEDEAKK